jgi:hypothetical protein
VIESQSIPSKQFVVLRIQPDIVLFNVRIKIISAQDFGDFDELIVIVVSVEEGLLAEDLLRPA